MTKSPLSELGQLPLFEFDAKNLEKMDRHQPSTQVGESENSKYIVYVDESGDHSLQSIDQQYPVCSISLRAGHTKDRIHE